MIGALNSSLEDAAESKDESGRMRACCRMLS